jgi:hypothetical protein
MPGVPYVLKLENSMESGDVLVGETWYKATMELDSVWVI